MNKFYTASTVTGFMIEHFDTYGEALAAIDAYQERDFAEGNRQLGLYHIVDEDHNVLHEYLVKIRQEDGSFKYIGKVVQREDMTAEDYAREHGLTEKVELEQFS